MRTEGTLDNPATLRAQEFGDRMRDMHAGILASLAQKGGLPVTEAPAKPLSAEEQRVLDSLEAQFQEPSTPVQPRRERSPRTPAVVRKLGYAAVGAIVLVTGVLGAATLSKPEQPRVAQAAVEADPVTSLGVTTEAAVTTTVPPSTTTEATTTTTEAPRTFEAQPGELIGTLTADGICLEADIYEFDESDKTEGKIGTGTAVIDQLIPEDSPVRVCEPVRQYADTVRNDPNHPEYNPQLITRADWVRNSSRGPVTQWQPVAGHERNEAGPLSVYPGQPGNAVISGHGSTYSAPFTDMSVLAPGSFMVFERSDGASFLYKVVGQELTADYQVIHNYTHPESPSTLSVYNCSDEEGNTGSDATRMVTRAVLVATLS